MQQRQQHFRNYSHDNIAGWKVWVPGETESTGDPSYLSILRIIIHNIYIIRKWLTVMEAGEPTRWRPQAADDGSSSSPEALLAAMEADGVLCGLGPKAREGWRASSRVKQWERILFCFSVLSRPLTDWWGPSILPRAIGFTQHINSNVNLQPKHPHRHTRIVFEQIAGHLVAQLTWPIKFTITEHHESFKITTGLFMRDILNHHYERKTKVAS